MLIVCPNCSTSYDLKPDALGDSGRTVRCARCQTTWLAKRPAAVAAMAEADEPSDTLPDPPLDKPSIAAERAAAPPDDRTDTMADAVGEEWGVTPDADQATEAPALAPGSEDADASGGETSGGETSREETSGGETSREETSGEETWGVPEQSSPPLAPGGDGAPIRAARPPVAKPPVDIETLAALKDQRKGKRHGLRFGRLDLPTTFKAAVVLQVVAIIAIFAWHYEIVRWRPQMASFFSMFGMTVNLRGIDFVDVHTVEDNGDGVVVLIVEGTLKNTTNKTVSVPRLRFAFRNAGLAELYAWTAPPDKGMLGPGETLPFRTRLASPPPDGSDVLVRFMVRQDFMNGSR